MGGTLYIVGCAAVEAVEEEQCPCNDCFFNDCDYWDSRYCCRYCRWLHGEVTPNCEDCNPMDI